MMRTLRLQESRVTRDCEITVEEARWLSEQGIADARPTRNAGYFDIEARHVFGVVSCSGLRVEIIPKMPVAQALMLTIYAHIGDTRHPSAAFFQTDDIVLLLGQHFAARLEDALRQGPVRGYATREATSRHFRGRLRIAEQMSRHQMRLQPLEIEFEDFISDIAENQILAAAVRKLIPLLVREQAGHPHVREVIIRLRRSLLQLGEVSPLVKGRPLPVWQANSINRRFVDSLTLAELILSGTGTGSAAGKQVSDGLLIPMWEVFEKAVARRIRKALPHARVDTQWSMPVTDGELLRIRPDILIRNGATPTAVMDTKYADRSVSGDDLYQVLAYASVLELDGATLIYASPGTDRDLTIHGSGTVIRLRHVDLSQPFDDVLEAVSAIARDQPFDDVIVGG